MPVIYSAQASAAKVCDLTWHVKGGGIQHVVGFFEMKGKGQITCADNALVTQIPVDVKIGGSVVAARSAMGLFFMQGTATGLGYTNSPMELLGSYATEQNAGAGLVGAGYSVGLRAANGATVGTFGVSLVEGLGYEVGFSTVKLSLDNSRPVKTMSLQQK